MSSGFFKTFVNGLFCAVFSHITFFSSFFHLNAMNFVCDLCGLVRPSAQALDKHMLNRHRNVKKIKYACDVEGCGVTYDSYRSYQKHRRSKHPQIVVGNIEQDACDADLRNVSENDDEFVGPSQLTALVGHFLMQTRTDDKLSDKAAEHLAKNLELFTADFAEIIKKNIVDRLENAGEGSAAALIESPQFSDIFSPAKVFKPFSTVYLQNKYIRDNFGMIEPVEVKLGQRMVKRKVAGKYQMKLVDCSAYIVPFLSSLSALLKMPEVVNDVLHRQQYNDELLRDIFDGSYCKNDPVLSDPSSLKILAYTDEFTAVNPIGTHTKTHKYVAFYYILCNIRPEFRSRLAAIQLLGLARSVDIKNCTCALERLLTDFVSSINALRKGVLFEINDSALLLRGGLAAFAGDTLASQGIGGFFESIGNAISPCRSCDVKKINLKSLFVSDQLPMRSDQEHLDRLRALANGNREFVAHWKREWGIKCRSPLLDVEGIELTKILIHDPQHVLLEGIDNLVMKISLRYFIERRYVTLEYLNSAIENFEYKDSQLLDKPNPISQSAIDSSDSNLRQTAASVMNLILLFPFMWGHRIPRQDEVWENLNRLRKINILSLSPFVNGDTKKILETLIAEHHFNYVRLFPSAPFTPKMHFTVHLPQQIVSHGPIRHQWSMRFEGKHAQFKSMNIRNYKNAVKTMAIRHQRYLCSRMIDALGKPNPNFLYEGDSVGPGNSESLQNSPFAKAFVLLDVSAEIFITRSVKVHGLTYQSGTVLVLELYSSEGCLMPTLAEINSIAVFQHQKTFGCNRLRIEAYNDHVGAYEVSKTDEFMTVAYADLVFKWPQLKNKFEGRTYVTLFATPAIAIA